MAVVFTAVADDDTGATDLAGMLAERGMRAILLIDEPSPENFWQWTENADAVIIGTASRSIAPDLAYQRTRRAIQLLKTLRPELIQVKYCSTFDSTPKGNIGQSIDAAMDESGERFTIALPALPVNGRTTYMGYHFAGEQILSDSSMKDHPLNPMKNSNLVSHLQSQTQRRVGLLPHTIVTKGSAWIEKRLQELSAEGVEIAVLDCISNYDLTSICTSINHLRLISGSSAPAMLLPTSWQQRSPQPLVLSKREDCRGFLVVAGSYSEATRRQNEWLASQDVISITLDALELAGLNPPTVPMNVQTALAQGQTCLLQVSHDREQVHRQFTANGRTEIEAGELIAYGLANLVKDLLSFVSLEGLILAGGETSSIISRVLGWSALQVGPNIEPGIPLCISLNKPVMPVVFKSGNFGSNYFYGKAINAIRNLRALPQ